MKRLQGGVAAVLVMVFCLGASCSRERVESLKAMNEGVTFAQQKRYIEATQLLQKATAVDPTNDQAYYQLAMVHMDMQKFDAAKDDLKGAVNAAAEPVAGYHEKLGTVQMQLEDWAGAKESFEKAIEIDPSLFKAYYKLAQVYERMNDPQNALKQYTAAVQAGPRFLAGYSQLGRLYANLGYLDQAVQVLRGALEVSILGTDDEADVHHLLGTVYQQ